MILSLSRLTGATSTAFVVFLLGLVTVLAGIVLVAELVIRSSLIYIVVALAPLVFACRLWPATKGAARKLLELLCALILSKLVIAIALAVAAAAAVGSGSGGEVTALPEPEVFAEDPGGTVTQAVGILLAAGAAFGVAAFSPLLIAKLLPLTEAAVVAQGDPRRPGSSRPAEPGDGQHGASLRAAPAHPDRQRPSGPWPSRRRRRGRAAWPVLRAWPPPARPEASRQPDVARQLEPPSSTRPPNPTRRRPIGQPPDAPQTDPAQAVGPRPAQTRRASGLPARRAPVGSDRSERTYRLEPLDTSGVFLGLGIVQCVLLGGGITLAVLAITAGAPLPVAIGAVLAAAGASFARAGGHPLWEWLPLGAGWVWRRLRHGPPGARRSRLIPTTSAAAMPPCLDGLDIVTIGARGGELGAIRDRHRHTLTVVVPVTGPQFVVEPRPEQERLLAGWGDVLGQFAVERGVVTHLAWSDLARPSGMHEHLHWIDTATHGQIHPTAADSYRDLVALGTASAISHEVVVTITVARDRLGRHRSSGGNAEEHLERGLITSIEALLRGLRSAGLTAGDPLDPLGVQRLIRTRIDPVATGRPVRRGGRLRDRLILLQACTAGPLALSTEWRHVRVDAVLHRTWWIGTWPRLAVPPVVARTVPVRRRDHPHHDGRPRARPDPPDADGGSNATS